MYAFLYIFSSVSSTVLTRAERGVGAFAIVGKIGVATYPGSAAIGTDENAKLCSLLHLSIDTHKDVETTILYQR